MYPKSRKDDEPYVDPTETQGQTRPDYSHSRGQVGDKQSMQKLSGGGFAYKSAIYNQWNYLDDNGHETFNKQAHKGGTISQQPALDHHPIQYAALNEYYHTVVGGERDKAQNGRSRTNSLDLHDAFKGAVADPENLRLVSHDEHVSQGGSKRTGGFSSTEMSGARDLFHKHMPSSSSSSHQLSVFQKSRPRSSAPLSTNIFTPTSMGLRSKDK